MINMLDPEEAALRDAIAANIRTELARLGRTPYWLAKQMDVFPSAVDKILKKQNTASAWFLVRAAKSLSVTTDALVATPDSSSASSRKNLVATA